MRASARSQRQHSGPRHSALPCACVCSDVWVMLSACIRARVVFVLLLRPLLRCSVAERFSSVFENCHAANDEIGESTQTPRSWKTNRESKGGCERYTGGRSKQERATKAQPKRARSACSEEVEATDKQERQRSATCHRAGTELHSEADATASNRSSGTTLVESDVAESDAAAGSVRRSGDSYVREMLWRAERPPR